MLLIRKEQIAALMRARLEEFARTTARALRSEYPRFLGQQPLDQVLVQVRSGLAVARAHGFESCKDLRTFTGLWIVIGPGFHQHRLVNERLKDSSVDISRRLDQLLSALTAEEWEAVRSAACAGRAASAGQPVRKD